jgi:hypothetical protein
MRILFADLAKARRDLIDSHELDDGPFLTRLWYQHLFWICSFVKTATGIYAKRFGCTVMEFYCKTADRLFGSNRYQQYLAHRQRDCERLKAKVRELKAEQQVREERRFDRRLLEERYNNPHFVISNRPHQDR